MKLSCINDVSDLSTGSNESWPCQREVLVVPLPRLYRQDYPQRRSTEDASLIHQMLSCTSFLPELKGLQDRFLQPSLLAMSKVFRELGDGI